MTAAPRISVLISTFNNARFVAKKLAEIQAQSIFREAEFLFIETASPEHERDLLRPFCEKHSNCRLITTDDRRTLYEAWNLGWTAARAPLLCYSNMDDAMHPRLLETVAAAMEKNSWDACSVFIGKQPENDPQLNDWSPARFRRRGLCTRPGAFTAWRTALQDSVGQFDGRFIGAGDLDFWSRLVAHRVSVGLIPKILYLYTKSPGQLSKSNDGRRAHDKALLAAKDYPITWHRGWGRSVRCWRWMVRLFPRCFCLPTTAAAK